MMAAAFRPIGSGYGYGSGDGYGYGSGDGYGDGSGDGDGDGTVSANPRTIRAAVKESE